MKMRGAIGPPTPVRNGGKEKRAGLSSLLLLLHALSVLAKFVKEKIHDPVQGANNELSIDLRLRRTLKQNEIKYNQIFDLIFT